MELKQIVETIERQYPKEEAMEWDNVGLLAGRMQKEVKHIYVAVDATDEVIEDARCAEADLLVTHHPLIFGGMILPATLCIRTTMYFRWHGFVQTFSDCRNRGRWK